MSYCPLPSTRSRPFSKIRSSAQEIRAVSAKKLATRNCSLLRSLLITNALSCLESCRSLGFEEFWDPVSEPEVRSCSLNSNGCQTDSPQFYGNSNHQDYLDFSYDSHLPPEPLGQEVCEEPTGSQFSLSFGVGDVCEDDPVDIMSVSKTPLIRCKDPSFSPEWRESQQCADEGSRKRQSVKRLGECDFDESSKRVRSSSPCSFSARSPELFASSPISCASIWNLLSPIVLFFRLDIFLRPFEPCFFLSVIVLMFYADCAHAFLFICLSIFNPCLLWKLEFGSELKKIFDWHLDTQHQF